MTSDYGQGGGNTATALMPGDVRDYLLEHPAFLSENDDLLASIVPPCPSHGDKVEDFQRFMLARLQEHFQAIKGEHDDLLDLMQEQMQRQNRICEAALALWDAPDFGAFLQTATQDLALLLDHAATRLFMEAPSGLTPGSYGGLWLVEAGFVDGWLKGHEILLDEKPRDSLPLYGEDDGAVRSHALLRLSVCNVLPPLLLALGHGDPLYYATGLATEQVEFLGGVIERGFRKWLGI